MKVNRLNPSGRGVKAAFLAAGLAVTGLIVAAPAAEARGFVSIGIGLPLYAPPPVIYAPPPVVYAAPPPVVYAPQPAPAYAPAPPSNCQPYSSTQNIGGVPQQVTGTACLQPDGTWRIVK
ncbi:MAG TPA: hypothetical protein VM689_25390 [Aliidongia sp.]|nr:hypothetical protein [Aliidongia sp.]